MSGAFRRNMLSGVVAVLFLCAFVPAQASNVFGRTNIATIPSNGLTADYKRGAKFTLSEPAVVTRMHAYLDGFGGPATGSQSIRLAIYLDANGVPGIKVGESAPQNIPAQGVAIWYTFFVDDVPLPPGSYWLVIHSGGPGGIVRDYADGAPNWYGNADTYNDDGASPFGSGAVGTGTISIYAEYDRPTERAFAGRSTIGATPSSGLSADFKRASKITLAQQSVVQSLSAYVDSQGGGSGTQTFRLALYKDANGVPGPKLAESIETNLPPGRGGRWISKSVPQQLLDAGDYWLAIHSGGSAGIVRDFGGGANNWYGNADPYVDGAASPFGSGTVGTGTMSVGIVYQPGPFQRRTYGRTTIGSTASNGLTADYARSQYFGYDLPVFSFLTGFWAYLDGNGGASGTQQVRIALYEDDCSDKQSAWFVGESEAVSITAGQPPGWVYFPVKSGYLYQVCGFWLALQSGGTQGVVRDYADGTDTWLGVQDTFADGPAAVYPSSSSPGVPKGTGQLSMYVEYWDVP